MYNTKFILGFTNDIGDTYEVFFDYKDYVGNSTLLYGTSDCLTIKSVSSDDDKLHPINGQQAIINIHVGPVYDRSLPTGNEVANLTVSIKDFVVTGDKDIMTTVYRNKNYALAVFVGFVMVQDISQPLMDAPYDIVVNATDGLGLLSNVDMITTTGELYSGVMSVEQWVLNILAKAGTPMNVRFYFPFYYVDADETQSSLSQVYLDAITFQKGQIITSTDPSVDVFASETDDALTALTKICTAFRCRLFQQNGVWHFMSLFTYFDPNGWTYNEVALDTLTAGVWSVVNVAVADSQDFTINVSKNDLIPPVEEDAVLYLKMATKWVKLNYAYDQSLNKICNQSLDFGDPNHTFDGTISSTVQDVTITPTVTFNTLGFDAFCFDHEDSNSNPGGNVILLPSTTPANTAYIREVDDDLGYLFDRYLVLPETTNLLTFLKTTEVKIDVGDILQISFQWRTHSNVTPTGSDAFDVAAVYLTGTDGTFWALLCANDGDPTFAGRKWVSVDADFKDGGGLTRYCSTSVLTDTVTWSQVEINQIQNATFPLAKAPVSGTLSIYFVCIQDQLGGCVESWIKNINVAILPYLQGTYKEIKGDYNFSSHLNTVEIKQTISEDISISDSPKRYFKGALLDASSNILLPNWHRKFMIEINRFTQFMERIYWNQVNRVLQKIEGTFKGFIWRDASFNELQAGLGNAYFFADSEDPFSRYMLTSFERNYATGKGRHVFVECAQGEVTDPFIDPFDPALGIYKFQYLFK